MIVQRRMLHKLFNKMDSTKHSIHDMIMKQWNVFNQRLLQLGCTKNGTGHSFRQQQPTL